jgi:hypothetical protein
LRHAILGQSY